ncbi:hypothetical protein JCM10295v2_002071 [Rhodotorula toruloides]
MGQSQSQQAIQPEHQGEIVTPVSSTRDEKGSGTDTAMGGQETAREGVDDSMERTAGEHAASSTVTGPSAPPPAAASSSTTETFKVPALPASSTTASGPTTLSSITSPSATMRTLPADIEHILSLGANQPDEAERAAAAAEGRGRQELEQAVRGLKENALKADGEVRMESEEEQRRREELLEVEAEMREKGVKREEEANEEDVDVTVQSTDGGEVKVKKEDRMADDSDSSDSSDSSESDSDSDTSESDSTTAGPQGGRRNRRNRQRAASVASDIDDDESGVVSSKTAPKTEHEVVEPDVAPPTVQKLDENVELAKFGKVESVIENVVVVKADTGGDWRVLDEGTVVCWEDRTVVGTIFETFGSVQQPFYSIRFPSSAPPDRSIFTISRPVFYSPNLASFVFTRDLRHIKGSDASNIWDEEVAAHEIEFSDDEEEAEHRKRIKAERRARTHSATPGPSNPRNPRASRTPAPPAQAPLPPAHPPASLPARPAVSYADTVDEPSLATTPSLPPIGPMAAQPRATVGEKPPRGRVGRRMFERDTGMSLDKGEEVEFEFSSGEGSDDDDRTSVVSTASSAGRGAARGGRGGRARGRGGQRGGGQGGRGGGPGGRPVAPLPTRALPTQHRPPPSAPAAQPPYSAAHADSPASLPPRQPPTDYYAQPQQQAQPYAFGTAGDASPGALNFGAAMQWPYAPAWPAMGGAYGYGTVPAAAGFYGGAGAAGAYQAPYGGGGASAGYSPHQPHTGNGDAYQRQGASGANGGYGAGQYQGQRSGQGGYGQGQGQGGQSSTGWYAGAGGGGGGW